MMFQITLVIPPEAIAYFSLCHYLTEAYLWNWLQCAITPVVVFAFFLQLSVAVIASASFRAVLFYSLVFMYIFVC